jgi:hypothetical protein
LEERLSHIFVPRATLTSGVFGDIQISMHTETPPMISIKFILPRAMLKEMGAVMSHMDVAPSRNAFIRAAISAYIETLKAKAEGKTHG